MSSELTKKKLPGKTRRAEEQHLKETLEIIRKNVEHYTEEVAALRVPLAVEAKSGDSWYDAK